MAVACPRRECVDDRGHGRHHDRAAAARPPDDDSVDRRRFIGFYSVFGGFDQMDFMIQQFMAGIRPTSLIAGAHVHSGGGDHDPRPLGRSA